MELPTEQSTLFFPHTSQPLTSAKGIGHSRTLREMYQKGVFPSSPSTLPILAGVGWGPGSAF